jgi:hypothetical protein
MNETPKTKRGWRIARGILIVLAVLATLIAIFYTEEDWRGKLAWEQCKRQLAAQGVDLDWNKFLPPSVPDDQNFFTASTNILVRFKQLAEEDTNELKVARQSQWLRLVPLVSKGGLPFPIFDTTNNPPPVVAEIIVSRAATQILVSPTVNPEQKTNLLTVTSDDPAAPGEIRDLINDTVGQTINGAQGFLFCERRLTEIQPAQIFVRAQTALSVNDVAGLIPSDTATNIGRLKVVTTADRNIYRVVLTRVHITAAADYLKWSDQYVPAFDEIREALKRPYAILPGDYSIPYRMPIPNFVTMRALAQTLAQRAQCDLLLGKPEDALHELTLVHDVCRILEKPPTGQPETLVEAMINVAIHGLYVAVIEEGMKRHAWQEPQLEAFQEQLQKTDLPPIVFGCLQKDEPAFVVHDAETLPPQRWFSFSFDKVSWQDKLLWFMPRGWVYQNITVAIRLEQLWWDGYDPASQTISPQKLDAAMRKLERTFDHHHRSPYSFYLLARIAIPNFSKAWQVTAYNQTMLNEAQIACALERCRLVHGEYPDTLEALTPGYIASIPNDIIGGQPLHYHRTEDGKFLLYSIGWNERDDGGRVALNGNGSVNQTVGDWVWLGGVK